MGGPCCCMRLRTAGILIGILEIVSWSINLTISGVFLVITAYYDKKIQERNRAEISGQTEDPIDWEVTSNAISTSTVSTSTVLSDDAKNEQSPEEVQKMIAISYMVTSLCLLLAVVRILIAGVLIFGVFKNNISMVKSWFAVKILVLFLTVCLFLASLATGQFQLGNVFYYSASIGASFYFLWVVFELMAEMKSDAIKARSPKFKA